MEDQCPQKMLKKKSSSHRWPQAAKLIHPKYQPPAQFNLAVHPKWKIGRKKTKILTRTEYMGSNSLHRHCQISSLSFHHLNSAAQISCSTPSIDFPPCSPKKKIFSSSQDVTSSNLRTDWTKKDRKERESLKKITGTVLHKFK